MNIDWSKAPEGATHYCIGSMDNTHWRDYSGHNAKYWLDGAWHFHPMTSSKCLSMPGDVARPKWNGEGLPPVGTVCEINHPSLNWVRCEIVAHKHFECGSKTHAIAWIDGDTIDQSQGLRFRPIRTPEQIAAEERESAIAEMCADAGKPDMPMRSRDQAAKLYDAGWRKQVKP